MNDVADEFYRGPILDYEIRRGELLRRRRVRVPQLDGGVAEAWQIVYASRSAFGAAIAASGIVIAPDQKQTPTAILVYCPAFHGLGGTENAPSQRLAAGTALDTEAIGAALERGWVVVVPDGQGMGLTGLGPMRFLARAAGARAALDAIRAVGGLQDVDWPPLPALAWGYADGGRTAVSVAEHRTRYAPEVDLRGVAAGAVVSDLRDLVQTHDGGPWSGLGLAGMVGLSRAYSHLPLRHILSAAGYEAVEAAEHLGVEDIRRSFPAPLDHWCVRPDPWNDPLWRYVLESERTAHESAPQVPVHLYHGTEDVLVPITQGRNLFGAYRAMAVDLSWREYTTGHARAARAGQPEALAQLEAFLHRKPRDAGRAT
ncbi:lipase family protein [Nocardia bhagyanarayanae]|uniref:Secretory lipase n=1 Tax=Nocardia bhagyanarayanae TaxID=1215925 RepID=A0A543FFX0_9NOCA|nr:lipase family protein [Nocardia bhagyanarayanae]TQM32671.1 secretory lipase [Nocardia bhagyanarayanae]